MNTQHQLTTPCFYRAGVDIAGQRYPISCTGVTFVADLRDDLIGCELRAACAAGADHDIAFVRTIDAPDLLPLGGSMAIEHLEFVSTLR